MNIRKEFIPFIICLVIVCLNLPIIILLYFLNPDFIGKFITIVVPFECIMMGATIIYSELKSRKEERKNYKVCEGIIKKNKFKLRNSNWLKTPIVSYSVNGKNYETTSNIGINGIISVFFKGRKIKVYYKEDNPEITSCNNNISLIVGTIFIVSGIYIFLI